MFRSIVSSLDEHGLSLALGYPWSSEEEEIFGKIHSYLKNMNESIQTKCYENYKGVFEYCMFGESQTADDILATSENNSNPLIPSYGTDEQSENSTSAIQTFRIKGPLESFGVESFTEINSTTTPIVPMTLTRLVSGDSFDRLTTCFENAIGNGITKTGDYGTRKGSHGCQFYPQVGNRFHGQPDLVTDGCASDDPSAKMATVLRPATPDDKNSNRSSSIGELFTLSDSPHLGFTYTTNPCSFPPTYTPGQNVVLGTGKFLLVTHPTTVWDSQGDASGGINQAVWDAKQRGIPIVYLQNKNDNLSSFRKQYQQDCAPTYYVHSSLGEIPTLNITSTQLVTVGGYWWGCQTRTVNEVIRKWKTSFLGQDWEITYLPPASYQLSRYSEWSDPAYQQIQSNYTTYNLRIISLGRLFSWIPDPYYENLYLQKRIINSLNYSIPSNYRIEAYRSGALAFVYRQGTGLNPPVLRFQFN